MSNLKCIREWKNTLKYDYGSVFKINSCALFMRSPCKEVKEVGGARGKFENGWAGYNRFLFCKKTRNRFYYSGNWISNGFLYFAFSIFFLLFVVSNWNKKKWSSIYLRRMPSIVSSGLIKCNSIIISLCSDSLHLLQFYCVCAGAIMVSTKS